MRGLQREFQKHTGCRDYSAKDRVSPGICHEVAREFIAEHGKRFVVYWDFLLDTPRYVSARETYVVAPLVNTKGEGAALKDYLAEAAFRFIDRHAAFFGTSSAGLDVAEVRRLGDGWLLLFRP